MPILQFEIDTLRNTINPMNNLEFKPEGIVILDNTYEEVIQSETKESNGNETLLLH